MELVITVRKKVESIPQGQLIYELLKQRLEDRPDVIITGHITNHFDFPEEPPGG